MSMGLRRVFHCVLVASLIACATQAFAVQPDEIMGDPAKEARARGLSRELRCMVCQNQSIDDSDAPLARDLRLLVRERIAAGDSDSQVLDFLVARYGAFVLLKPRFEAETLALWLLPPIVLAIGAALLWAGARRRRKGAGAAGATAPLSTEERAELKELLAGKEISPGSDASDRSITKV
jgi:cytochrome c-type biogenesis protein CcmH